MKVLMKITSKNGQFVGREINPEDQKLVKRKKVIFRDPNNKVFDEVYQEIRSKGFVGSDLRANVQQRIYFGEDCDGIKSNAMDPLWIDRQCERCENNYFQRVKRFKQKAYMNDFNYMITFTYDSAKTTERAFSRELKKSLENMTYCYGWRYMGVPERGEKGGRLHYHYLVKIPNEGTSYPGKLYARAQWSSKRKRYEIVTTNTYFDQWGNSDWRCIDNDRQDYNHAIGYVQKYLGKDGSRAIYSRNLKNEVVKEVDTRRDVMFARANFGKTYLLFSTVIRALKDKISEHFEIEISDLTDWREVAPPVFFKRSDERAFVAERC